MALKGKPYPLSAGISRLWEAGTGRSSPCAGSGTPRLVLIYVTLSLTCMAAPSFAQTPPVQLAQVVPPSQIPPPFPPEPPPLPKELPPGPPPPVLPPLPPPPPTMREPLPLIRVFVREIRVLGSTVFTQEELAKVTAPYTNREVTAEDLEAIRQALTLYYVDHGYVTSGAIIPDQTIKEGVLTIQIVEGKLSRIEVEGTEWFLPSYLQNRIELGAGPPVNVNALQERLQLLQADNRIQRLNAELRPGLKLGESTLNVRVAEANPIKAWLEFNNYQSPSVGAERGLATLEHQNVTGLGDILTAQYGRSEGIDPQLTLRYALPITVHDTTISAEYRKNDFIVVEEPFESLDIKSKSEIIGFTLRHPVYRTLTQEFALALTGEHLINKTFLLGEPFDFTPGSKGGVSRVSALRLSQEWVQRTSNQVISAFSRFSLGIGVLGATTNGDPALADGRFFSWLGQAQWARRLEPWRIQIIARGVVQLADDRLFPLEQIAVGGRYSVRGYRENTLVRDNAYLVSLEPRVPVITSALGVDLVQVAPFVDVGKAWNTTVPTPDPETLASIGLGVIWNIIEGSRLEVYWGQQLNHVKFAEGNLQDHGLHFQLIVQVF